ncbi:MAG: septum formation initiator family protein [Clostridiales bacterium]|nr:septum formation initiator family protein [Clostridiales bacterium]MBO4579915.1 septum formation initiator family protein [Clostridiales bacterium]
MRKIHRKSGGISFLTAMIFIAFIVVAVLCITRFNNIMIQKQRLTSENSSLKAQASVLSDKLARINAQAEYGNDDQYVISIARGNLDMVYPGEIIFRTNGQ